MNYLRLRLLWVRIIAEWHQLGGLHALIRRCTDILRAEGGAGLMQRIRTLMRRGTYTVPADSTAHPSVLLIGHPTAILGVGENLRSVAGALDAAEIPFEVCDALANNLPRSHSVRNSINLFCLNANEMDSALADLGPELFRGTFNMGLWMWELASFPAHWTSNFRYVQEIWAQSRFVQESIARVSPVPTVWIPQPVEPGPADPILAATLGVPSDRFTFLCFVDFRSYVARKNPGGALEAFRLAFDDRPHEPVALVVKMLGADRYPAAFRQFMDSARGLGDRLIIINRSLSGLEMRGLLCGCDSFVSLHRSEGFGRGIAEAMYYSKPTIATAYSGNLDFCNHATCALVDLEFTPVRKGEYPFWQGQFWAEPCIAEAAQWMQRFATDSTYCTDLGQRACDGIRTTHSAMAVGRRMYSRLTKLGLL
jgi:glycosyltransferase involved in cell wall biosynthesis